MADYYHWGVFFRPDFGDTNGYAVGIRAEAGPRIGPIRLTFGAGLGLMFIPDTEDALDAMTLSVQLVGVVYQWKHLVVQAEAFTLDFHVLPGDANTKRDPELQMGFSSGLSVGARF